MNSWTTRLAFAGKWVVPPRASRLESAIPPSPPPDRHRNSRRDSSRDMVDPSVDEDEFVQVQNHPASVRQSMLAGIFGERLQLVRPRFASQRETNCCGDPSLVRVGEFRN